MQAPIALTGLSQADVERLAADLAFVLAPGDCITLSGDLGAGKSTFARALLRTLSNDDTLEVPSPTFTLVQPYVTERFPIAHADLYRVADGDEIDELGLDDTLKRGVVLIEWPERAGDRLPASRFDMTVLEAATPDTRDITLTATADTAPRLKRFADMRKFLASSGWGDESTRIAYMQGDASARRYARVEKANGERAILMDSPAQGDGPPIRDGKPYSRIAHLAENIVAFVAIAEALSERGLKVPTVLGSDLDAGFLIIEDLGDHVFTQLIDDGADKPPLYTRATDALVALHKSEPPEQVVLDRDHTYALANADADVFSIEVDLVLDWYWPALYGTLAAPAVRQAFSDAWQPLFSRVLTTETGWLLRDYHSPNLIALDGPPSPRDIGIIDFQDAMRGPTAYDVVSLLQDARRDVPEDLERPLMARYVAARKASNAGFDEAEFRFAYAVLGAQRNSKILGIFARLAMRDGKRQYLPHLPRIWGYLERNLAHPELRPIASWYDTHMPTRQRREPLRI